MIVAPAVHQSGGAMDAIRGWIEVIQDGGWSGLLMAGFAVVAGMFIFAFISNKYFWIVLAVVAAALGLCYYFEVDLSFDFDFLA